MRSKRNAIIAWLMMLIPLTACQAADDSGLVVQVTPDKDLAKLVGDAGNNAKFVLEPGVYRGYSLEPKDGQQFVGKNGAILNGAMLLTKWTQEQPFWIFEGLPEPLRPHGDCLEDHPACPHREDLFVDNKVFKRVLSVEDLRPGAWYRDGNKALLIEDPRGKRVEVSVVGRAFGGRAADVTLRNLIVEKYASQAQAGAIDARHGTNWEFVDITARWNHGIGLFIGNGTRIERGLFTENGQMGLGGVGDDVVIDGPEISYNNYAGFHYEWESGGFKFVKSRGMIVRNACVHHNNGVGMWNDIDNIDTLFENNKVFDNNRIGILQEISYAATIRNNIVARNASDRDGWMWGSNILVQNSKNVEVYGNLVEVAPTFGNGIGIIHQNRGDGAHGRYVSQNNRIFNNRIIHTGVHGRSGFAVDYEQEWFRANHNNVFDANTYVIPNPKAKYWRTIDHVDTWDAFRKMGMEPGGRIIVRQSRPMALSCSKG